MRGGSVVVVMDSRASLAAYGAGLVRPSASVVVVVAATAAGYQRVQILRYTFKKLDIVDWKVA